MLRLLARDTDGVTLVPPVVVKDELNDGLLVEHYKVPDLYENFYAITINRQFQTPMLKKLLSRSATDILED